MTNNIFSNPTKQQLRIILFVYTITIVGNLFSITDGFSKPLLTKQNATNILLMFSVTWTVFDIVKTYRKQNQK